MSISPKRGLGRGLGALLGDAQPGSVLSSVHPVANGPALLRVDSIHPNPWQPRNVFEPIALGELEQSIRELGVLVPILVRRHGERYELIAGERRWRAAAALHLETIPAIVRDADDRESLEVAIVENVLREDLDPLEEAMGYANLMEEYGYTQERVADRLGKSRSAVANALRLLALPDLIKADLRSGALSVGHAKALLTVTEGNRLSVARRIVSEGLTVRDVERIAAEDAVAKPRVSRKIPRRDPNVERAESLLRYRLGAQVVIESTLRGGRIVIRYSDGDDLMRLVDLLDSEKSRS